MRLIRRCIYLFLVFATAGLLIVGALGADRPVVGSLRITPHSRLVGVVFDWQARLFWANAGEERLLAVSAGVWRPDFRTAREAHWDALTGVAGEGAAVLRDDAAYGAPAVVVTTTACGSTRPGDVVEFATVQHFLPLGRFDEVGPFAVWWRKTHSLVVPRRGGGQIVALRYGMLRTPVLVLMLASMFFPLFALRPAGRVQQGTRRKVSRRNITQDASADGEIADDGGGTSTRRQ